MLDTDVCVLNNMPLTESALHQWLIFIRRLGMGNWLGYIGSTVHLNLTTLQNVNRHVFFWRTRCSRPCIATNKHHDDTLDFHNWGGHLAANACMHMNVSNFGCTYILCLKCWGLSYVFCCCSTTHVIFPSFFTFLLCSKWTEHTWVVCISLVPIEQNNGNDDIETTSLIQQVFDHLFLFIFALFSTTL